MTDRIDTPNMLGRLNSLRAVDGLDQSSPSTRVARLSLGRGERQGGFGYLNIVSFGLIWNLKFGNWDLGYRLVIFLILVVVILLVEIVFL
jgi:hypothetical protein